MKPSTALFRAVIVGHLSANPGRAALSALGILIGVALATAVTLLNGAAVNEFTRAARAVSGEPDVSVVGETAVPEALYPRLASAKGVAVASPVVEMRVSVAGRRESLKLAGRDFFRAGSLSAGAETPRLKDPYLALDPDTVTLSMSAARWLGVGPGDTVTAVSRDTSITLRIIAVLPQETTGERLGIMDIAGAQWLFGRPGELSRIDLKLDPGVDAGRFIAELAPTLPAGVRAIPAQILDGRVAEVSRAYRANLAVLSTIALVTGGFLVFATATVSVVRRRPQLALLRVLGFTRRRLVFWLCLEAAAVGLPAAVVGVALGYLLARGFAGVLGGDLGAGYFAGIEPTITPSLPTLAGLALLGVAAAVAGALPAALEVARAEPARALKTGETETSLVRLANPRPGIVLIALAAALAFAPAVGGLPLAGYASIAFLLAGAVALVPWCTARFAHVLHRSKTPSTELARLRLRNAPGGAALAIAPVVASFALTVSMAVMVDSFRGSVDAWLTRILRADLYLRSGAPGATASFSAADQQAIASLPGIARVEFLRFSETRPDPRHPPVVLIARPIRRDTAARILPLIEEGGGQPADTVPVWISEAVRDIHGWRTGQVRALKLGPASVRVRVAGIWRDYARQHGAIALPLDAYRRASGDVAASDAHLWLVPGADVQNFRRAAQQRFPDALVADVREIRAASLEAFDRSFTVTYALEAAAILVGLFGVSAGFSAEIASRRAELAVLRHLGLTRRDVTAMVTREAAMLAATGIAIGLAGGLAASQVLVRVINPQSFHWSMDFAIPGFTIAALIAITVAAAIVAARLSVTRTRELAVAIRDE